MTRTRGRRAIRPGAIALFVLLPAILPSGAPLAAVRTLAIDPVATEIKFVIHRPGETIEGTAPGVTGSVTFDPQNPSTGSSVELTVDPNRMETGNGIRDRKMKKSHLEVERFPAIVFRSTSVQVGPGLRVEAGAARATGPAATPAAGSGPAPAPAGTPPPGTSPAAGTHVASGSAAESLTDGRDHKVLLEGTLSLHGVDRVILIPASIRYDGAIFSAEGEATLRLTDHSIPIPKVLWIVLDDEVKVRFKLVTAAPAPAGAR